MGNQKGYKHKLGKRILIGCAVFCAFLCLFMGVFDAVNYFSGMIARYQIYMEGILNYTLTEIDADDLERCIRTGKKSEAYEETQRVLDRIKENYEIAFIYIVKPLNTEKRDNMIDVMSGVTSYEREHEKDTLTVLGALTGTSYTGEVAANYLARMDGDDAQITYFRNRTRFGNDFTGLVPIVNSDGEKVAILAVDISVDEIGNTLMHHMSLMLLGTVFLIALFLTGIYRWLKNSVIVPIARIQKAAERFLKSSHEASEPDRIDFEELGLCSDDEIQALAEALATMADDLKRFMKDLITQTREKERIGTELALAARIQADILPCTFPAFPDRDEFDIYAMMSPAKEVGGDFYDFFMVDDRHLAIVIADVSGKGVPAALFMVIGKTLIKDHTQSGGDLGTVFTKVNDLLCESNKEGLFITAFEGVLDLVTGEFCFVNAGHEVPFLCKKGGVFQPHKLSAGFVLAGMQGMRYACGVMQLGEGDRIFQYTDGVTEAINAQEEFYGINRLEAVLAGNSDAAPKKLLQMVKEDIDAFVGSAQQFDDITMLCLEYRKRMNLNSKKRN